MDELNRVAVPGQPPFDFVLAADRLSVARQHELRLERQHRVQRVDVLERPARRRAAQCVEVWKRLVVVVADERGLELRNPDGQVIGRLARRVNQLELHVADGQRVALVERAGRLEVQLGLRPRPRLGRSRGRDAPLRSLRTRSAG